MPINSLVLSTGMLQNEWGSLGSGFFFSVNKPSTSYNSDQSLFFVTNKHVLDKNQIKRKAAKEITLHLNKKLTSGELRAHECTFQITYDLIREHPNPIADVLAIEIPIFPLKAWEIEFTCITENQLATEDIIKKEDIGFADDVLIIGHPSGYTQGKSNLPIIRTGIVATKIGEVYIEKSSSGDIVYPGFLIDGGIIPGSSGSPVFLKPSGGRLKHGNFCIEYVKPYLLGIIAQTRFAPVNGNNMPVNGFANLGLAFDAKIIKETLDLFFT